MDTDEGSDRPSRYRPESIQKLCQTTQFSREELQTMYRGFKQECPAGVVNDDTFKVIFAHFFPQGNSDDFASTIFKVFDTNNTGLVTFEQFVNGLSILSRGSVDEKLHWSFNLYDSNKDGMLTKEELLVVVKAMYQMMGTWSYPAITVATASSHVDDIFSKMDSNSTGFVTFDEYMAFCKSNPEIVSSMMTFDAVL